MSIYPSIFAAEDGQATRDYDEPPHEFRTEFQRDRDRILYSKEFRRLSGKTQVFVAGFDDHVRTRLTHTLEVAQIANTILHQLGLNELLGEAIALGHDLGHTPFGHIGERTLNYILNGCDGTGNFGCKFEDNTRGFKHNWQGIRTVTDLEKINEAFDGLNLTDYVRWGILHHTDTAWKKCDNKSNAPNKCNLRHHSERDCLVSKPEVDFYTDKYVFDDSRCWSIEAIVVKYADEIAQRHHDVEDGLMTGLIDRKELILKFTECFGRYLSRQDGAKINRLLTLNNKRHEMFQPAFATLIINFLTTQAINETKRRMIELQERYPLNNKAEFYALKNKIYSDNSGKWVEIVGYPEGIGQKDVGGDAVFQKYLKERVLNSQVAQAMDSKSNYIVRQLFTAYMSSPQQLPNRTVAFIFKNYEMETYNKIMGEEIALGAKFGKFRERLKTLHNQERGNTYKIALLRTICDYIAGMTDQYAIDQYELLYGKTHFA